jgi:hypothetical protein
MIVRYECWLANLRSNLSLPYISDFDWLALVTIDDGWSLLLEAKVAGTYAVNLYIL